MDAVEANLCLGFAPDQYDYMVVAAMLQDQEVTAIRLMTNNPHKVSNLESNHIRVMERIPHQRKAHPENQGYLRTKAQKLNHLLVQEVQAKRYRHTR